MPIPTKTKPYLVNSNFLNGCIAFALAISSGIPSAIATPICVCDKLNKYCWRILAVVARILNQSISSLRFRKRTQRVKMQLRNTRKSI